MPREPSRLERLFPRQLIGRRLARLASHAWPVRVRIDRHSADCRPQEVILRKEHGRVVVSLDLRKVRRDRALHIDVRYRPAGAIAMFSRTRPELRTCRVDFSDGETCGPGIVGFSSNTSEAVLIPDCDFYTRGGYRDIRRIAANAPTWSTRGETVLWRGSSTGAGLVADDDMSPANAALAQRVRMCLILRDRSLVDARLTNVAQADDPKGDLKRLLAARIYAPPLPPATWLGRKFALDIDGNTNAWGNLFHRLLMGCCVIKIASPGGYRQWYYDDLVPWRHYVPVKADMSDLVEKIEWCRANEDECAGIATAGKALADSMTFRRELERGVDILNRTLPAG